jgi:hypothetical protein
MAVTVRRPDSTVEIVDHVFRMSRLCLLPSGFGRSVLSVMVAYGLPSRFVDPAIAGRVRSCVDWGTAFSV